MSDEFEDSNLNENSIENSSNVEIDSGSNSAIDDPKILESLKQLSLSEQAAAKNTEAAATVYTPQRVKNIVEAAILAANKAISLDKILTLFSADAVDKNSLRQAIEALMQDYQSRGVELVEVGSGFRFQVAQTVAPWVSRLWEEKPQKYSRALLETLALVAYRQPVTRGEIEEIRGVSVSSQIMRTLVEREWVRIIGYRDVPGKPAMYATTKQFLDYFSLKKLDELPTLAEIRDLDTINAELDFGDPSDGSKNTDIPDESVQDKINPDDSDSKDDLMEINDSDERIDIDVSFKALSETYKQIDSIETDSSAKSSADISLTEESVEPTEEEKNDEK